MKILVVYYSFSGNTKRLAEDIALVADADIRELVLEEPYSFSYNTAVKEVRLQIDNLHCPKLIAGNESVDGYDLIFIGSPNWLKTFAPPVRTFLRDVDLSGKIVVPFCTHGGGAFGSIISDIKELCPDSELIPGLALSGAYDLENITEWFDKNNNIFTN